MSKFIRYNIRTTPAAEDLIVSAMTDLGLCGAQIEDNVPLTAAEKEQIYTYDADDPVDDGIAHVSFYAAMKADGRVALSGDPEETNEAFLRDPEALREEMEEALSELRAFADIGDGRLSVSITDDAEWKDKWKQFFHSFWVDDILITPSWETTAEAASAKETPRHTLRIDPGTAFGTGAHETTQLAIRALRGQIEARLAEGSAPSALDIGTGSGILSILALMFGAGLAVGTDLDAFTKEATVENLAANDMDASRFHLVIGNLIDEEKAQEEVLSLAECYDIVVANILPVVLTPLTPVVPRFMKQGGVYITSGILCEKEEEMRGVLRAAGFVTDTVTTQGEWCCLVSRFCGERPA